MVAGCGGVGGGVSHAVTIVPRLEYSAGLLSEIIEDLRSQRRGLVASTRGLIRASGDDDPSLPGAIDRERAVAFSLEVLLQIRRRVGSISGVSSIPGILAPAIPAVRTASAQLYDVVPACSRMLSELSVHLGSILLDSAIIATAKFDFGRSNSESALFLDEVKLMTDSKINKQYRNLGFLKG